MSRWTLIGKRDETGTIRQVVIASLPFNVGRRSGASLCLPQPTISSEHAEFFTQDDDLFVRDLHSTNGTYVNGGRVQGIKQLQHNDLVQFADMPFRLTEHAKEFESRTIHEDMCDRALALVQIDKLLTGRAVIPHFQPIVELSTLNTIGVEILGRSRLVGLETPYAMFRAAAQLNLEVELSRILRLEGCRASAMFAEPPHLFVNTHPAELAAGNLAESMETLRAVIPTQPVTVEIHEGAVAEAGTMCDLRARLDDLNIRLAFDDFGAGQGRLAELAEVQPHYIKFDLSMIKDIHLSGSQRKSVLGALVQMVTDLGVIAIAEGVEQEAEGDVCRDLGFQLAQGFYYGRPAPVMTYTDRDLALDC